jgi:iron-sulfur cluster assembly enzyme ISCU, mitochondrial
VLLETGNDEEETDCCAVHCSMLAEDAIKSAITNYYTKNPNHKPTNLAGTSAAMPKIEPAAVASAAA